MMARIDFGKCKIEFPQVGKGLIHRIVIDNVEWGTATAMPEGRYGLKFFFKDVTGAPVRFKTQRSHLGKILLSIKSYEAHAQNRKEIDNALRPIVIRMITADDLKHPQEARSISDEAKAKRQRATDDANVEKRKLWEEQANKVIAMFDHDEIPRDAINKIRNAIIEAMEWAQAQ